MARALVEEADEGVRGRSSVKGGFCWMRAIKPGILSFDEGVGCTYTSIQDQCKRLQFRKLANL